MSTSSQVLADFIRAREADILRSWETVAANIRDRKPLSRHALLNDVDSVLHAIADRLDPRAVLGADDGEALAMSEHAMQRAEIGSTLVNVTAELFALRDAIEEAWPGADGSADREVLAELRHAFEQVLLETIGQFVRFRLGLLESVDEIVRGWDPNEELAATLERLLGVLLRNIEGIDTLAVLLKEDEDVLRVRAAVGLEEATQPGFPLRIGQGFVGLIAAERAPRLLHAASDDPLVVSPFLRAAGVRALYGVPLLSRGELLGVAHMGSLSVRDFSDETKALFGAIVARVVGVIHQDVLNDRLKLERSRYRAIFDNSPGVIYAKDSEGVYLTINARAHADLGLSPEAFIGHTDHDVFPPDVARALREADARVMQSETSLEQEDTVQVGDELHHYLTTKFPLFDTNGRVVGVGGISTEITERRRREDVQRLLLEAGRILAGSLDFSRNVTKMIERVVDELAECSMLYVVDEEHWGRPPVVCHRDRSKVELARRCCDFPAQEGRPHLIDSVLRTGETLHMPRVPKHYVDTIAPDEEQRDIMLSLGFGSMIQTALVARGRVLGALVLLRGPSSRPFDALDVSVSRELAGRISLAIDNSALYSASRRATHARDEVLGVVAHDLRNPIGTIALAAESLASTLGPAGHDAQRQVQAIRRAAGRMETLVGDLLDQHAIERGLFEVAPRTWPAQMFLQQVAEEHGARVEAAALRLDVSIPSHLPEVAADRDRVLQVFGNLLSNAVKFTPRGGRIRVGARVRDGRVCYCVRDTGAGMSRDALRHLFDRYWQARREDRRGVGLGLAIAKGIVEAHGGAIWASSAPGEGTTVCFTLPCARAEAARRLH